MATRAQLEKYAQNPKVRKFLDLIAHTEGTEGNGYRTAFGGGRLSSLGDHPRYMKSFKQQNGKTNKTSAAGRYQFLSSTWDGVAKKYGFNDFSPKNQDLGAIALLAQNGALGSILKGDMQGAVRKSGSTWASLPTAPASYSQPTKSWRTVNNFLGGKGVSNTPQQEQFARPERISIKELQAREQQSSAFQRPDRIPIEQLQAQSNFERPERVPISQLQQQDTVFERPERLLVSDLQGGKQSPSVFGRPERVPIERLQSSNQTNPMPEQMPQQLQEVQTWQPLKKNWSQI
tara:strand:- start:6198 stop:7064 length:867 start_codon:yes stop_codon:yes gene_type:complete